MDLSSQKTVFLVGFGYIDIKYYCISKPKSIKQIAQNRYFLLINEMFRFWYANLKKVLDFYFRIVKKYLK